MDVYIMYMDNVYGLLNIDVGEQKLSGIAERESDRLVSFTNPSMLIQG